MALTPPQPTESFFLDPDQVDQQREESALRGFWIGISFAVLQGLFFLLFLIYLLSRPSVFLGIYSLLRIDQSHGDVRALLEWMNSTEDILGLHTSMREGLFSQKELAHYQDVRSYLQLAQILLVPVTFFYGVALLAVHQMTTMTLQQIQVTFCKLWGTGLALLLIWMLISWDSLFTALHYPLFGSDSWRFPVGAYSLRLFPESVWAVFAVFIAIIPLFLAGLGAAILPRPNRELAGVDLRWKPRERYSRR